MSTLRDVLNYFSGINDCGHFSELDYENTYWASSSGVNSNFLLTINIIYWYDKTSSYFDCATPTACMNL